MAEKQLISTGSAAAPMCANGCGFYGSAIYNYFCSKCFKDSQAAKAVESAAAEEKKATTMKPESTNTPAAAAPPVTAAREATAAVTEEQQEKEAPPAPIICATTGCGYFGSAEKYNLCSMCYVDRIKNIDATPELLEMIKAGKAALVAAEKQPVPAAEDAAPAVEAPAAKAAPNRCQSCRKKVGLLGFSCSCGGLFCSLHRHAEKHACEFDFKKAGRERIAEKNPLIAAPKIDKI
jgi:hypothetical protein